MSNRFCDLHNSISGYNWVTGQINSYASYRKGDVAQFNTKIEALQQRYKTVIFYSKELTGELK